MATPVRNPPQGVPWSGDRDGTGQNVLSYSQQSRPEQGSHVCQHNPKGKTEGVLAFIIPVGQHCLVLNGMHCDAGHQGQQQTLALTQERFWWPMMTEDCCAIVRGCLHCQAFEGEVPRAPLCLIQVYAPLELVHLDYTSIESMMDLNKPPVVKNVLVMTDHFTRYALVMVTKDQTAKTVVKVFYEYFIAGFAVPTKLLSNRGQTSHPPWWRSYALPSISRSAGPQLTMLSVMARWNVSIRHCLHDWQAIM